MDTVLGAILLDHSISLGMHNALQFVLHGSYKDIKM